MQQDNSEFILNEFIVSGEAKEIGKLVKQRRKELTLTQKELADYAGTSIACISKLETQNVCPSFEVMMSIATKLCIPPNLFMHSPNKYFML